MRDTRGELLLQAEALIRTRGFSGFSYADLASLVGIRKASIHHHFPTKIDLAAALVAAYDTRYDIALERILTTERSGPSRVEAYAQLYLLGVEQGLGCLCAMLASELQILPEPLRCAIARFFEKHIAWLAAVLIDAQKDGTVRATIEPSSHARMIIATLEGALMMERLLDSPAGFRSAVAALKAGLAP